MTIACFCGNVFESTRSTACPRCGEPVFMRESYESPAEFEERIASHVRTEDEIRALPETPHPGEVAPLRARDRT
jgi:predicted  nucleic acid-binding Zn-ribbon protein